MAVLMPMSRPALRGGKSVRRMLGAAMRVRRGAHLSSSGPPELPGLMAASVCGAARQPRIASTQAHSGPRAWMTPRMGRPLPPLRISRPSPDTTPVVSVWSSPKGLPGYSRHRPMLSAPNLKPQAARMLRRTDGVDALPDLQRRGAAQRQRPQRRWRRRRASSRTTAARGAGRAGGVHAQHCDVFVLIIPHNLNAYDGGRIRQSAAAS